MPGPRPDNFRLLQQHLPQFLPPILASTAPSMRSHDFCIDIRFNINMRPASLLGLAMAVLALPCTTAGMAPRFSWDTLANMASRDVWTQAAKGRSCRAVGREAAVLGAGRLSPAPSTSLRGAPALPRLFPTVLLCAARGGVAVAVAVAHAHRRSSSLAARAPRLSHLPTRASRACSRLNCAAAAAGPADVFPRLQREWALLPNGAGDDRQVPSCHHREGPVVHVVE